MSGDIGPIIEEVEYLLAAAAAFRAVGPRLQIIHRFHRSETSCAPGEEVAAVYLVHRSELYHVRLGIGELLLFDYLAKSRLPQSAAQIQAGVRSDPFYTRHAWNSGATRRQVRRINHVRVYVKRIREALALSFREAGMDYADPYKVLVSETTTSNSVLYALKCSIEWVHESLPRERNDQELRRAIQARDAGE
jgi:hypothetical protein